MSVSTMKKLTLLAYSADADAIVRRLMKLRCVELKTAEGGEGLTAIDNRESEAARAESERRLVAIRDALPSLAKYTSRKSGIGRRVHHVDRDDFVREGKADEAWRTVEQTLAVKARMESITAEVTRTQMQMQMLLPWLDYDVPLGARETARTCVLFGTLPPKTDLSALQKALEGVHIEEVSRDGNGLYTALTFLQEERAATERALLSRGFVAAGFPPELTSTAQACYENARDRLDKLAEEHYAAEEELRNCAEGIDGVEILFDIESTAVLLAKQKRKLLSTRHCALIEGWLPSEAEEELTAALSSYECACELSDPDEGEDPPVLLRNNRFVSTFEWVIGMYSYPKYGTYDPAVPMSIFYFLIFGMMFADVGYGLLLVLACFGGVKLLNPKKGMRQMLLMFGYCGISCMLMGVLFGGWFGNLPTAIMNSFIYHADGVAETTPLGHFFANGLIFNPIDSSTGFLVLSLAVGEVHLIAGMILNMIENCKRGDVTEGLCSTIPFLILFAGIDLVAPALVVDMVVADPASVSAATRALFETLSQIGLYTMFAGFGAILLFRGLGQKSFMGWLTKGLGGLYSLIGLASDLLSYSRILALGLVAGVIEQVINMMTGMGASGPIGFVFMLVVMLLGHGLNLAINLLGTFVHAARLQYIEFFGKFYEDGGTPFSPLVPVEEYSEEE